MHQNIKVENGFVTQSQHTISTGAEETDLKKAEILCTKYRILDLPILTHYSRHKQQTCGITGVTDFNYLF